MSAAVITIVVLLVIIAVLLFVIAMEHRERMAKAAGKVNPVVMVAACSMLIECAWMVRDPSGYVDFKIKQDAKREEGATP